MNNIMIITRGIPASGKSTFARSWVAQDADNRIEVNRDNIRKMLGYPPRGNSEQEDMVTDIHASVIAEAITRGKSIIVSDTNMRSKGIKTMAKTAIAAGYDVEIKDFHIDLNEAIRRDAAREDSVGEDVVRSFYHRSKNWEPAESIMNSVHKSARHYQPYRNDPNNPPAILVDIDGTIAHNNGVRDYHDYTEAVLKDSPDMSVIKAVNIAHDNGIAIIVMSGRKDSCKEPTIQWLNNHSVPFDHLYMRDSDDNRADWIVKDELVRAHIQDNYHILWCYDDRDQVVRHHRAMGYQVFQVAPGDF